MERRTACLADGNKKTYAPMILTFACIYKINIQYVNYCCCIELSCLNCIIHNDRNSFVSTMPKTTMDWNYHLEKNKYIKRHIYIYITCSRPLPTLQKMGPHKEIEFADFHVYKAWQFSKYKVRIDPIFEVETLKGTHRIREVGCVPLGQLPRP